MPLVLSLSAACVGAPEETETDRAAVAAAAAPLECSADDITSGERVCAGSLSYSLECYARRRSEACGAVTTPVTCTSYASCTHPDFGIARGTYTQTVALGWDGSDDTCDDHAQAHLATLSPEQREGVTYTYSIGGPYEEEMFRGSAAASSIQEQVCYITYRNYPFPQTGTGPQCGTVQSSCAPACVNPATCRHPDFGVETVVGTTPIYRWGTGAQCGTLVGPCSASSLSPLYNECRHASHGPAAESECGPGFDGPSVGAPGATVEQMQAQAQAQWAAAGNLGAPVYDAAITCSDCRYPIQLTREQVLRRVYASAGMAKKDARLHVLAGAAYYLSRDNPALSTAELTAGLATIAAALHLYSVPQTQDGSGPMVSRMVRILAKAEPAMSTTTAPGRALRAYARDLLASMRSGLDQQRRLAAIQKQVDRYADAEAFISESWSGLFDRTTQSPALAAAVNDGPIGAALGVRTTDTAPQILTVHPVEPLKTFVLAHLEPDGSLSTTAADIRALLDTASTRGIAVASAYAENLFELNAAEQAYRDAQSLEGPASSAAAAAATGASVDALKAAIEKAERRNKEIKETLKDAKEGVSGALGLAADLAARSNDPGFADDIRLFSKALETTIDSIQQYSESAVKTASKLAGILDLGATGLNIISGAIFTGQLVGAVFKMFSLLDRTPAKPPIEQIILTKVNALKSLVEDVRDEMRGRFDRVDRNLNLVYGEMTRQFALVNWNLGVINGNVGELQAALFAHQADLNRLDRHIYAFLDALGRRPFVETVNGTLGWRERVLDPSIPLPFNPDYLNGENRFYSWSYSYAADELSAGPEARPDSDDAWLTELTNYPLAFNINYLRVLPSTRLGLSPLSNERMRNPLEWIVGAEAYSQLAEEWPEHAARVSQGRRSDLLLAGSQLEALRRIERPLLFTRLAEHYEARWAELKDQIAQAEAQLETSPEVGLFGVDLWGGPDQRPSQHYLSSMQALPRCSGGEFTPGVDRLSVSFPRWPHDELVPFMVADNLDLGTLNACIEGHWSWHSYVMHPWGTTWTFRLYAEVHVRYNGTKIYTHNFSTTTERTRTFYNNYPDPTFNPDTFWNPYPILADRWGSITAPDSVRRFTGESARTQARAAVAADLKDLQRSFYASVATRMTQAGDSLALAANRLSGSKRMWESYVAMGLPLSLEHNEALRELLYGSDAVLTGRDVSGNDDHANDVEDSYRFFSVAPPDDNVLTDIDASVLARAGRLEETIDAILTRLSDHGDSEAGSSLDATMLRLRLGAQ